MQYILEEYKNILSSYTFIENNEILNLPNGTHIIYFPKDTLRKKSGILNSIKDNLILVLYFFKNKWYIYRNENYIFYRLKSSKLRNSLQSLLDSDFKIEKKSDKIPKIIYKKDTNIPEKNYLALNSRLNIDEITKNLAELSEYYSIKP